MSKFLFKNITIINSEFQVENNKDVIVNQSSGNIEYIADTGNCNYADDENITVYDGKGKVLMPGFINSHAHSPMMLLRGYGENLVLQDWLEKKIFPFEAKLNGDAVYWSTMLAMAESLRFGITSTTDMYYFSDDMIDAIKDSNCKNNISRAITNFEGTPLKELDSFKEMVELYNRHHKDNKGKIKVDASIHAEYTSNPETVQSLAEYNEKVLGARVHIHLSETKKEHEECIARHGVTPTEYFDRSGLLDMPTTAAHCVWVTEKDMSILRAREVNVACNPISNMKLASGVCNVPKLLDLGINVSIGTDSVASNNSLNFIEEMKMFSLAPKMQYNKPDAISPREAVYAATRAGAISQGRIDTGLIKEDYKADLIVLNISEPHMIPCHDLLTNIVYSASGSDVMLTMVDGEVLYEEGVWKSMDISKVMAEVAKHTKSIINQL